MLKIIDQQYFEEVKEFARRTNRITDLEKNLSFLENYAIHDDDPKDKTVCDIYRDFAPYSFYFVMFVKNSRGEYERWFNGGLIFHGKIDNFGSGSAPTFAVTLTPTDGWSIHT